MLSGKLDVVTIENRVSISSRKQYREDKKEGNLQRNMTYHRLQEFANNYIRSHRLEESVAHMLRELGLNAKALPAVAHGRREHAADIEITLDNGDKATLEVKEARNSRICLGLPVEAGSHLHGYKRLPQSLIIDSAWAWDNKVAAAEANGEHLLGALALVTIGRLSDDFHTTLGIVYCPSEFSNNWEEWDTCNGDKCYTALKCPKLYMRTLADLVADIERLNASQTNRAHQRNTK